MAAKVYYSPFIPAFSSNGAPVAGATLTFLYTATTTPAPVWADAGLSTPLQNPVPSDGAGKYPPIYLDDSITYRVIQKTSAGAQLGDAIDPYIPGQALQGPPGPAGNVAATLIQLKAADTTNVSMIYDNSVWAWTTGNFTGQADDVNIVQSSGTALTVGAWVRSNKPVSVEQFSLVQDAAEYAHTVNADVYLPAGDYTGAVDDTSDAIFEGPGRLFDADGVQLNTYAEPRSRFVIGQEYLWAFHTRMLNNPVGSDIICQGDSTTRGAFDVSILPTEYQLASLLDAQLHRYGIWGPTVYNRGTSGMTTREWLQPSGTFPPPAHFLEDDLADYPTAALFIMRWGLNDGSFSPGYHDIAQYREDMREALTRIRDEHSVEDLSIILMTPNTTSETHYRDEAWHEQVARVLKRAARDFKCCFIDAYALWRDARAGIDLWLDSQGAGGSGIHPDKVFNHWIADEIARVAFSPIAIRTVATNAFLNVSGTAFRAVTVTAPAEGFDKGFSCFRTDTPNTFPLDGTVEVFRSADGIVTQVNKGYTNETTQRIYTRIGQDAQPWSAWRGEGYELTLASGWTTFSGAADPVLSKSAEGLCHFSARVVNAAATSGSTICTLLPGFLPLVTKHFLVCNGTNDTVGRITIQANGAVKWISGTNTDVIIDIVYRAYG